MNDRLDKYAATIWDASRADEGTISATGARHVAAAVMGVADAELAELRAELDRYKRGAKTLGEVIEKTGRMVLDATGRHDLIDDDGDGDWGAVWDHLSALRPRLEAAQAKIAIFRRYVETRHRLAGLCPEEWNMYSRDPYCPACVMLTAALDGE